MIPEIDDPETLEMAEERGRKKYIKLNHLRPRESGEGMGRETLRKLRN